MSLVEPGGARTEFRYGSAQVAALMPVYDATPAHAFLRMLDPANGLAPGDPARMATRIIESVDRQPAPLRMVLGSQALQGRSTCCVNGCGILNNRSSWRRPPTSHRERNAIIDNLLPRSARVDLVLTRAPQESAISRGSAARR
ncbi:hypothetical protein [Dickeya dadantii]|uniref:hypothetical protein n=1 Tax=Dickeya dadantii TaxID=204038 RepID=UPI0020A67EC7|nr:hypothetical protein [Dickeya dadantii]